MFSAMSMDLAEKQQHSEPVPVLPTLAATKIVSWDATDAKGLRERLKFATQQSESARTASRELSRRATAAIELMHRGEMADAKATLAGCRDVTQGYREQQLDIPELRDTSGFGFEDLLTAHAFEHFLLTGKVVSLEAMQQLYAPIGFRFSGNEYVGACCSITQELVRYSINRASELDSGSVELADACVQALSGQLSQFDYRNGPLRRKYDGIKYRCAA